MKNPPAFPGIATAFQPFGLHDIVQTFDQTADEFEHSYRAIYWWARHGMNTSLAQLRTGALLTRMADFIDDSLVDLEKRLPGTLNPDAIFVSSELKEHGRPGQFLATRAI